MIGTLGGAVVIVVLSACFPQDRAGFSSAWLCGVPPVLSLRQFCAASRPMRQPWLATRPSSLPAINWALSGGGQAFTLALTRVTEICIGIVSAGIILAGSGR